MYWKAWLVAIFLFPSSFLQAQQSRTGNQWKDYDFFLGEWTWVGGGQPGQGRGVSTFRSELDGTVLVRKTHLDYAATKQRAAFAHDDVIYVYHDPLNDSVRAIFFDREGHVILYRVTVAPDGSSIKFLSDAAPDGTRCRMTYRKTGTDSVTEKFEIAPAEKPYDFTTYVDFRATRVGK